MPKIYVGYNSEKGEREVFTYAGVPSHESHPAYGFVIGPFRTKRAAKLMTIPGNMFRSVQDAEHYARNIKKGE